MKMRQSCAIEVRSSLRSPHEEERIFVEATLVCTIFRGNILEGRKPTILIPFPCRTERSSRSLT